jgi:lipopolysaccharide/colanic/teichoic acid biosynthesis glycosyltransferase
MSVNSQANARETRETGLGRLKIRPADLVLPHFRGKRETPGLLRGLSGVSMRAMDLLFASILLILMLPIVLIAILLIRLDSPGPAFYRSMRVGYKGRPLRMLKFRKMVVDATGAPLTADRDDRFTRIGRWLAKLKLDEIPQLWHVVRGEMSLVGPRPEDPRFVDEHREAFELILSVRPGVTGFSQIAFAEESRILDTDDPLAHYVGRLLPQKIGLDLLYAANRSVTLNIKILFWTGAAILLRKKVSVHRETGAMRLRRR